jgi:hypothetical protein
LHKKEENYKLKSIFRDDVKLNLSISIKLSSKKIIKYLKINLINSMNNLNSSLDSLSKNFKIDIYKGVFS